MDQLSPWLPFSQTTGGELLLIGMAAIKAALNLLPSEKPVQVFGYLDALVNWLISDHLNPKNEEE
ncbi:hypothetical protein N9L83_02950 [Flavobacteriales bacterium]|nr:hypothetical protein [Flavobacteriales bacterium]